MSAKARSLSDTNNLHFSSTVHMHTLILIQATTLSGCLQLVPNGKHLSSFPMWRNRGLQQGQKAGRSCHKSLRQGWEKTLFCFLFCAYCRTASSLSQQITQSLLPSWLPAPRPRLCSKPTVTRPTFAKLNREIHCKKGRTGLKWEPWHSEWG